MMDSARRVAFMVVLALGAVASNAPSAAGRTGPAGEAFYDPPAKLVPGEHGSVVWERPLRGAPRLRTAARNRLLLYRSVSAAGEPVAVSGTLAIPKGRPPRGGWPVISWGHGATGSADSCAPSRETNRSDFAPYLGEVRKTLEKWVRAGYAVVQTDYQGLGTRGPFAYQVGLPAARSMTDIVRAARATDPGLSRRWLAMGHSLGGHAALWTGSLGQRWAPDLKLTGVVALAPASRGDLLFSLVRTFSAPNPAVASAGLSLGGAVTAGWEPSPLTERATALLDHLEKRCVAGLQRQDSWGGLPPNELFRDDAALEPLTAVLAAQEPATLNLASRVFIGHGAADTTVPYQLSDLLVDTLKRKGTRITYRTYPGVEHDAVVSRSLIDTRRFVKSRFR